MTLTAYRDAAYRAYPIRLIAYRGLRIAGYLVLYATAALLGLVSCHSPAPAELTGGVMPPTGGPPLSAEGVVEAGDGVPEDQPAGLVSLAVPESRAAVTAEAGAELTADQQEAVRRLEEALGSVGLRASPAPGIADQQRWHSPAPCAALDWRAWLQEWWWPATACPSRKYDSPGGIYECWVARTQAGQHFLKVELGELFAASDLLRPWACRDSRGRVNPDVRVLVIHENTLVSIRNAWRGGDGGGGGDGTVCPPSVPFGRERCGYMTASCDARSGGQWARCSSLCAEIAALCAPPPPPPPPDPVCGDGNPDPGEDCATCPGDQPAGACDDPDPDPDPVPDPVPVPGECEPEGRQPVSWPPVIQTADGGLVRVPDDGLTSAESAALGGILAGNPVGGPSAEDEIRRLARCGVLVPGERAELYDRSAAPTDKLDVCETPPAAPRLWEMIPAEASTGRLSVYLRSECPWGSE